MQLYRTHPDSDAMLLHPLENLGIPVTEPVLSEMELLAWRAPTTRNHQRQNTRTSMLYMILLKLLPRSWTRARIKLESPDWKSSCAPLADSRGTGVMEEREASWWEDNRAAS